MVVVCQLCTNGVTKTQGVIKCTAEPCKNVCHARCAPLGTGVTWTCPTCLKAQGAAADPPPQDDSPEPTLRDVMSMLAQLQAQGQAQKVLLESVENSLALSIELCNNKIDEVTTKVSALETNVDQLDEGVALNSNKVRDLEERLLAAEQYSRVNDADVNGIPYKKGENLNDILASLGRALSFPLGPDKIEVAHRVGPESATNRGIYVRFLRKTDKEDFVKARKVKRDLALKHLGLSGEQYTSGDDSIFINDSLCPALRKLVNEARRLKREKSTFAHVWVSGGKLYVKKEEASPRVQITRMQQLSDLAK